MPLLEVQTNLKKSQIPDGFLKRLSAKGSELSLMPEAYVAAKIVTDVVMTFGGTDEPCALIVFSSVGKIKEPEQSAIIIDDLHKFIPDELKIKPDRFFILYKDWGGNDISFNGMTVGKYKEKIGL